MIAKILIEKPDYRNNGQYQFVRGYTPFGNPMCDHWTKEQIEKRCEELNGPGELVDDGENLWWTIFVEIPS